MKRQRGQSAVEFALISPIIFLLIFAAIYGGAMFIQFMNLSNQARTVARQLALAKSESELDSLLATHNGVGLTEDGEFAGLYKVTMNSDLVDRSDGGKDVVVVVTFDHGREFPFNFPPKDFAIQYRMMREN